MAKPFANELEVGTSEGRSRGRRTGFNFLLGLVDSMLVDLDVIFDKARGERLRLTCYASTRGSADRECSVRPGVK